MPRTSRATAAVGAVIIGAMAVATLAAFAYLVVWPYTTSGVPPADWSPSTILVAIAAIVALYAYLGANIYRQFGTVLTESGISVPTLRGRRVIAWSQIERVGIRGHEVLLHTADRKIVLNTLYFADRQSLTTFLQSHLPGRVVNGDSAG